MQLHDKAKITADMAVVAARVVRTWGTGVGVPLVARYFSEDPWITAADLAMAAGVSEDTARRKLEELANVGRVVVGQRGRTRVYKARRDLAERTFEEIKRFISDAKCG